MYTDQASAPWVNAAVSHRSAIACLLVLLVGWIPETFAQAQAEPGSVIAAQGASTAVSPDYVLAPGDLLRIQVYQQPDLSMEIRLQDNGQLSFPLIGPLTMTGLSVFDAERRIEAGLRDGKFLRSPQVSITVTQVRGNLVSVLGHVQRPGRFPIEKPGLRLTELLAQAGGVTAMGSDGLILIGVRKGLPYKRKLELQALFESEDLQQDPVLEHGDVIFIDRAPMVYLYGEVQRPGPVRLERQMTVLQALAAGGGPTPRGSTRGLKVTRQSPAGDFRTWVPELNAPLQPGDVLHIPESLF
jgi:polysaccharide biosynthesis/export protein